MKQRIITSLGLIALFVLILALGYQVLNVAVFVLVLVAGYEIYLAPRHSYAPLLLVVVLALLIFGIAMIVLKVPMFVIVTIFLMVLFILTFSFSWFTLPDLTYFFTMMMIEMLVVYAVTQLEPYGVQTFLYILIATYVNDTFAYLGGTFFGKRKLAPRISPNKTLEGSLLGYVAGAIAAFVYGMFVLGSMFSLEFLVVTSLVLPLAAQIGDLAFSAVKRNFKIKDFGYVFPGHGGVLDRIDSVIFALIIFNMIVIFMI